MIEQFSERKLLFLALSHLSFLRTQEKFFLGETLHDINDLLLLSILDLSKLIKRPLRTQQFSALKELEGLIDRDQKLMHSYDIRAVSIEEKNFPPLLREIADPPQLLFYRGSLPLQEKSAVGIVGTRRPSNDGIYCAMDLGKDYAHSDVSVISGLAMGIDAYAHKGCVDAGGQSFGVLACGLENIYPRSNTKLAAKMIAKGGLISEYPPETEPMPFRFPQRNRIISGLSQALIVVEAPKKSGALITVDFALDQGRDVFVCSKVLASARNEGGRRLHEDGAYAITNADDIFNDEYRHAISVETNQQLFNENGESK